MRKREVEFQNVFCKPAGVFEKCYEPAPLGGETAGRKGKEMLVEMLPARGDTSKRGEPNWESLMIVS